MDKQSALLTLGAFGFVLTPFILTACAGTPAGQTEQPTQVETQLTQETSAPELTQETQTEETETPVDVNQVYSDLQKNLPPYFQNSDVSFTGIKELDTDTMLAPYKDAIVAKYEELYKSSDWDDIKSYFRWYEVGNIVKGKYTGQKLLVLDGLCEGMCMYSNLYRFAYDSSTEKLTFLRNMSSEYMGSNFSDPIMENSDDDTVLKGVMLPEKLTVPNGKDVITLTVADAGFQLETLVQNKLYTDPNVGTVYSAVQNGLGCLFVARPDGTIAKYEYDPGLFEGTTTITWDDASGTTKVAENYGYSHYGCGIQGNCYAVEKLDVAGLKKVGSTSTGVDLYEVNNPVEGALDSTDSTLTLQQKKLDELYQMHVNNAQYREDKTIMTWDEYLAIHPVLYFKDPFGRYSSIINSKVQPMAECGKPVVYLYPEKTQDVSVKVLIDEFTKTVPEYGNGWFVKATPDSEIYNYADGQTYPYLFWEGHKKGGMSVDRGFMVAREDVATFLPESLKQMGLNEKETADFMDFWVTRMLDNPEPYFFVSFIGTADFNKVAPLEISPAPDTLIRVFMYYHPVDVPFSVQSQDLKSIPRNGFTVVEWGGTSSRPWVPEE